MLLSVTHVGDILLSSSVDMSVAGVGIITLHWSWYLMSINMSAVLLPSQALLHRLDSGSYKYVHILVSLRNTSFKILVSRILHPVARKNLTHFTIIYIFCTRHWCQSSRCAAPTEMHCPMAVERIECDASRIHFGVLWLCLLSFIITCFRLFPPALKTKRNQDFVVACWSYQ